MSILAIRAALETQLATITPPIDTAWENFSYTPIAGTPYQQVNVMFATPDNPEMSAGYRELGYLQVTVRYPLQNGSKDAASRAKLVRDAFPKGLSLTNSGVVTTINKTPAIGSGTVDDDHFCITVKIPFHANLF